MYRYYLGVCRVFIQESVGSIEKDVGEARGDGVRRYTVGDGELFMAMHRMRRHVVRSDGYLAVGRGM